MPVTLTENDSGRCVSLRVNDTLRILLPENPTTGYRWELDLPTDGALMLESAARQDPSTVPGATIAHAFSLRAARPGNAEIAAKLWRDWEGEGSVVSRFHASVRVT